MELTSSTTLPTGYPIRSCNSSRFCVLVIRICWCIQYRWSTEDGWEKHYLPVLWHVFVIYTKWVYVAFWKCEREIQCRWLFKLRGKFYYFIIKTVASLVAWSIPTLNIIPENKRNKTPKNWNRKVNNNDFCRVHFISLIAINKIVSQKINVKKTTLIFFGVLFNFLREPSYCKYYLSSIQQPIRITFS